MTALIVDDEASNRENLQQLLSTYAPDVKVCALCATVTKAMNAIQIYKPQLLLLDIQLQGESGFDLLKQLDTADVEVIFITAYDQYGIQAIKFAALDYLLKPIDIDELKTALEKARQALSRKQHNQRLEHLLEYLTENKAKRIALPLFNETRYAALEDIMHCEADNTYTHIILKDGERILVSRTLKEFDGMLAPQGFLRAHQSHLVNKAFIKSWLREDGGCLLLLDGTKIPVSKLNRDKVKAALDGKR